MADLVASSGYGEMEKGVKKIEQRIKELSQVVNKDEHRGSVRQTLDPARTCVATNPPREFPSVAAMEFFLRENSDVATEHKAFTSRSEAAPPVEHAAAPAGRAHFAEQEV